MKIYRTVVGLNRRFVPLVLIALVPMALLGQAETVPATHPVYAFLKRMEVKQMIERYRDAMLPLSRQEVGDFLTAIASHEDRLTSAERSILQDYLSEFQFEVKGTIEGFLSVIDSQEPSFGAALGEEFSNREKFLYAMADSNVTMFVNGLLTVDARRISGNALGSTRTEFVQFGGRIRGSIFGKLGYSLLGTNAQFWGSRDLLLRDPLISQSYTIRVTGIQNFDFSEGYARYDAGILSLQFGKERILWGAGYDQRMISSENVRPYEFLRADVQYKALKYTFFHGSLLGRRRSITFTLPPDTATRYNEPVVADKYFAAHRIEFSFPRLFDIGFQEMAIYSNRSVDFAYLNPFVLLESAQRSREERDNVFWAFDLQTHLVAGLELMGTVVFDDLHFPEFFKPRWYNRYAYQLGAMLTDPLFVPNATLMVEYTRVKPFVYAHDRSRENTYTSLNSLLGPRIGPNADSWFVRADYFPAWNLTFSASVLFVRHGRNVYDDAGRLIRNVGGDVFQPHRPTDPLDAKFLDGIVVRSRRFLFLAVYEFINQTRLEAWMQFDREENTSTGLHTSDTTGGIRLRVEL